MWAKAASTRGRFKLRGNKFVQDLTVALDRQHNGIIF